MEPPPMRMGWWRWALLAVAILLGLELAARQVWPVERGPEDMPWFQPHDQRSWALRPGRHADGETTTYTINDAAMRGPAPAREEGRKRLLMMGDSCTFGVWLQEDETVPAVLQEILEQRHPGRYRVYNGGVPGYSSVQGLLHFRELAPKVKPDLVIAAYGANDLTTSNRTDAEEVRQGLPHRAPRPGPSRLLDVLVAQARGTGRTFQGYVDRLRGDKPADRTTGDRPRRRERRGGRRPAGRVQRVPPAEFQQNLETLASEAAPVLLVQLPFASAVRPEMAGMKTTFRQYRLKLRDAAVAAGVPTLDLQEAWGEDPAAYQPLFFPDGIHPNAAGARRIATDLADALEPLLP